ncbi:MAG: GNAT family N-acetyltransferase [Phycisphaerales bacterium]
MGDFEHGTIPSGSTQPPERSAGRTASAPPSVSGSRHHDAGSPSSHSPSTPRCVIRRVPQSDWIAAAERLVSAAVGPGRSARLAGERFLAAAAEHNINLTDLHASFLPSSADPRQTPRPRQVCLAVPGSGATATFFTTSPDDAHEAEELGQVIDAACNSLSETRLAQALLTMDEHTVRQAFATAGFQQICELAYLSGTMNGAVETARRHPVATTDQSRAWPDGVRVTDCRAVEDAELVAALRSSYQDTLDCPELCALRRTEDVLRSHKDAGRFDPKHWWLVRLHGTPVGAALLSRMPEQGAVELVYLGIAPELRGQGLGRRLLSHALLAMDKAAERNFQCAVDLRNKPALTLYASFGLRETARRRALVRPL